MVTQVEAGKGPITDYTELPVPEVIGLRNEGVGGGGGGGAEVVAAAVLVDLVAIGIMLEDIRVLDARDSDKQI